jgi:hypothetical protein
MQVGAGKRQRLGYCGFTFGRLDFYLLDYLLLTRRVLLCKTQRAALATA